MSKVKKFIVFLLLVVFAGASYTMVQFSKDTGKKPWQWSKEEWGNYVSFTKTKSQEAGSAVKTTARSKGSASWKWVTKNTESLFEKSKGLLKRLGSKEGVQEDGTAATAGAGTATVSQREVPADPLDLKSSNYKYGKQWLAKGIAEWQVSLVHPGAAERAKDFFERASSCFRDAKSELMAEAVVDELLVETTTYLHDTNERIEMIAKERAKSAN